MDRRVGFWVISLEQFQQTFGDIIPNEEPTLESQVEGRMTLDQILMLLSSRQQLILLLTLTGYKKHAEVAKIMNVSISTIEKERRKIRSRIEDFMRRSV